MSTFLKVIAGVIIAVILYLVLPKQIRELSVLLSVAVCCMVGVIAFSYLSPVLTFVEYISQISDLDQPMIKTLFKAVGICLISEFTCSICNDSGNAALSKLVQFMTTALLLSLSIPYLTELLDLIKSLLTDS